MNETILQETEALSFDELIDRIVAKPDNDVADLETLSLLAVQFPPRRRTIDELCTKPLRRITLKPY